MTRFDLDMDGSMEPSEHGRWVRYEDAQRTWVGLTEAQCGVLWKTNMTPFEYYQAIEAKLKEKNT